MEWTFLAIKPSNYISGLCYSILRLEPYSDCSFACVYCYARWYRAGGTDPRPQWRILKLWKRTARRLEKTEPKPFFRLATLSDPFQPVEERFMVGLEMLRIAYRYEIPVIVNTKSDMLVKSPWLDVLTSLADRRLLLVQLTIGFSDPIASLLEPHAPPPSRRLEALETLAEHGIPVVVRVQPLIPGLEEDHLSIAREALERGALGIIGESLRETVEGFKRVSRLLGFDVAAVAGLEPYQLAEVEGRTPLYHPRLRWRLRIHEELASMARVYGRAYASCKDGVQRDYHPGRDCCLTWISLDRRMLRPTLHEYVYLSARLRAWLEPMEFLEECRTRLTRYGYVCGNGLDGYPNPVRKAFRLHERKLLKLVETGKWRQLLGLNQPVGGGETVGRGVGG